LYLLYIYQIWLWLQGDNIQVLLPADLCPLWGPKLHEGSTYVMKNFKVLPNDFSVKFCDHAFKLVLSEVRVDQMSYQLNFQICQTTLWISNLFQKSKMGITVLIY
jgi:hypothetical protein